MKMWFLTGNRCVSMLGKEVIGGSKCYMYLSHNCGSVAFVVSCVLFQEKYSNTDQIILSKLCT